MTAKVHLTEATSERALLNTSSHRILELVPIPPHLAAWRMHVRSPTDRLNDLPLEEQAMDVSLPDFAGLRVAAFESRRAEEMARMIERLGGVPHVSPSMREVVIDDNPIIGDFVKRLITGQIEVVIFMTGVGFEYLLQAALRLENRDRILHSLKDITTIARGPKPVAAMKKFDLQPTLLVPAPNTWRELLTTIDAHLTISNLTIAVQEYGKPNPSLTAGLEARGARVLSLEVYRWDLPTNTAPLGENIHGLLAGQRDICLFTSAHQVDNVLAHAAVLDKLRETEAALRESVICSIGPTTSARLRAAGLPVDLEPSHSKMGHLVADAARHGRELLGRKQRIAVSLSGRLSDMGDQSAPWHESRFLRACRGEPNEVTPIWLMRQAGRYLPEYRAIREKTSFLELCKSPALCAEIMVTTVRRLGVDAAIIFSDLLPILEPMGLQLEYAQGEGPVIHNPVREAADVDRILELESVEALEFVMETVRMTRQELPADIPVIGFAGSPFTLASYVIEGGSSRNYLHAKTLMYRDAGAWNELMQRFVRSVTLYLNAQIAAGAQCVQLFDSWAGCLSVDDYRRYVMPHVSQIIAGLTPGVPVINFATGNPCLLPCLAEAGGDVIGVDWRIRLDDAWQAIGRHRSIQGNLDPLILMAERHMVQSQARKILEMAAGQPGHIFNLGHGVLPQTPVDNVLALIDAVHEWRGG